MTGGGVRILAGNVAVVCGFGNVGEGVAASLQGQGAQVLVVEIDPIRALQAAMQGYQVTTMEDIAPQADIFITATGNINVITLDHLGRMKDRAIVCNVGDLDTEIQIDALRNYPWAEVKRQVDEVVFPDGKKLIVLAKGRRTALGDVVGMLVDAMYAVELTSAVSPAPNIDERPEDVIDRLFGMEPMPEFEDGMSNEFSEGIEYIVKHFGNEGVDKLRNAFVRTDKLSCVGESLRTLGLMDDARTADSRLGALMTLLKHPSSIVRDAAVIGLAYLDDSRALSAIEAAIQSEPLPPLRHDMESIRDQLANN